MLCLYGIYKVVTILFGTICSQVKRQRLELHRQLQRELDGVKPEGRDELKEVSDNTTKFLALIPPSSHNEGKIAKLNIFTFILFFSFYFLH